MLSKLSHTIARLRNSAIKGTFTPPLNLHLTLATIGETDDAETAIKAFNTVESPSTKFHFSIGGLGTTKRGSSDVYWVAVRQNTDELNVLAESMVNALDAAGLPVDKREFNSHLTIGRDIVVASNFNRAAFMKDMPEMRMDVEEMELVSVEREDNRLVYKTLATKKFS